MYGTYQVEDVGRGLDAVASRDSTAGYFNYSAVQTRTFSSFQVPSGEGGPAPYDRPFRPSRLIGPTDVAAPMPLGKALSHKLQVIDRWAANTDWGGGMLQYDAKTGGYAGTRQGTYPTLWWQERPPLELPRYNYAAMDTQQLYDEARERVAIFQRLLFGKARPIGGAP